MMTALPTTGTQAPRRAPFSAILAVLAAFATFALSTGYTVIPSLAAAGLVMGYISRWRLPSSSFWPWLGRGVFLGMILLRMMGPWAAESNDSPEMLMAHTLGLICMVELTLQSWMTRPWGEGYVGTVLLSAVAIMAASNTFDNPYFQWLLPLYLLLLVRSWMTAEYAGRLTWRQLVYGWIALGGILLVGGGLSFGVWRYRFEINRLGTGLFALTGGQRGGLGTSPELGASFNPLDDISRVLKVRGVAGPLYLRAMTFDTYHNGKWGPLLQNRRFATVQARTFVAHDGLPHADVRRLGNADGFIYAPLHAAGLVIEGDQYLELTKAGPLRFGDLRAAPATYGIALERDPEFQGPFCKAPDDAQRAASLALPGDFDPRVRVLARRIERGATTPRERIEAVTSYLISHHAYSLTANPGTGDPVTQFLLEKKAAHCEYFASAATLLLRTMGVPTRYVIGYYGHEQSGANELVVRQRDAHAWAECWVAGQGWVTVDATPDDGRPDSLAPPIGAWKRWMETAGDSMAAAWRVVNASLRPLLGGFLLLGCLLLLRRIRRRDRVTALAGFAYSPAAPDLAAVGTKFQRWLHRQGYPCPPHRTWEEHLAGLSQAAHPLPHLEELTLFVRLYNEARFAAIPDPTTMADLQASLTRLTGRD